MSVTEVESRDEVFDAISSQWSNETLTAEEFLAGWKRWLLENTDAQLQLIIKARDMPDEMRQAAVEEVDRRWKERPAVGGAGGPSDESKRDE